ncbi:MAG: methyltransferase [Candidatus Izimaplasma sp.]|nr:methyltransferase [Candidatus Izimaplasma bacterium]
MLDDKKIEQFYDYFDKFADHLYKQYTTPYIKGMNEAFNFLLDNETKVSYSDSDNTLFSSLKDEIKGEPFKNEEVRKAVQLGLLKGYKHSFSSNELITPDTIGIFTGYLVKKLFKNASLNNCLDPLIGSGNYVYSTLNQLDTKVDVVGVDHNEMRINMARNLGDLMDIKNQMYFQDTFSFFNGEYDLVLTDMPIQDTSNKNDYFPYKVINHHLENLLPGGFFIAVIENDFFEQEQSDIFKKELSDKAHLFGLIKLSESLFNNNPKSILIIQKIAEDLTDQKDFLLANLPPFTDIEAFNKTLDKIDTWFSRKEDDIS